MSYFPRTLPNFRIDWQDRNAVIGLAKTLGPGHSVVRANQRKTFNIIHTTSENKPRIGTLAIIHRT